MKPPLPILAFLALMGIVATVGCTQNQRARQFGGTATIDITAGRKVIGASFKEHDLWVLTRPMRAGETPEVMELTESSSFGIMQGTVVLREH